MATVAAPPRRKKLEPFTMDHFRKYSSRIILDTGDYWQLEPFQEEVIEPILEGVTEVWTVIPEGNAKTTLLAGIALYHTDFTFSPWVPIGASSRDQAEILALQAMDMVRRSPGFLKRFRPYEGYRKITSLVNGGRGIKVYAAEAGTGDGVIPTLAICDEGHRWPDLRLYRLWKGKLDKRGGQIVMISTAGEPGGEFEEARDKIRDEAPDKHSMGAHRRSTGPAIVMNEWFVQNPKDVSNMARVKDANPLSTITEKTLQANFDSPTTDLGDFKRLKCNIPARSASTAITDAEWESSLIRTSIRPGERIELGVDVAWKHDTFAIQPLLRGELYKLLGDPTILTPPRDGSTMDPEEVKDAFELIISGNPVDTVVMDMERATDIAAWLEDEKGITVIDWSQGNVQAAEDYENFMKELRGGRLKHTGHPGLQKHVMNAVSRNLPGDKRRFDRPSQARSRRKQEMRVIDCLTAASMVNSYAVGTDTVKKPNFNASDYRVEGF